ncbi:MAG: YdbH domain-containing protein [Erythrobacter sp.]|uniref:intermembrane phospholipid transport protein YdbH family protein n=1 Tax=Erythrobacter sp. TaxID=1042 RepID=UPI003A8B1CFC
MTAAAPPPDAAHPHEPLSRGLWPKRWRWRISLILLLVIAGTFAIAWLQRERIAANLIDNALAAYDLPASYEIVEIGTGQQIIRNLVIGDPSAPDLTAEEVRVGIVYSLGAPTIGRIELVRPRLYGSFKDGAFSLGSLDRVIYADSDEPPGLPALDVAIRDGRALIASDYGRIAAKLDGEGPLDDGFKGMLAVTAPSVGQGDCRADTATLYGQIETDSGSPAFDGPLRLREVECQGARLASADIAADLSLSDSFESIDARFDLAGVDAGFAEAIAERVSGNVDLKWSFPTDGAGRLRIDHDISGERLQAPGLALADFAIDGALRTDAALEEGAWDVEISGSGARVEAGQSAALASIREAGSGSLIGSLATRLERGLDRALAGASLGANTTLRWNADGVSAIIPEARLRSAAGETVLAVSRASYTSKGDRFAGNFRSGGEDLPIISGRMEQVQGGELALKMTLEEYRAGADALSIPALELRQDRKGRIVFDGVAKAQGAIRGGSVRGLSVPLKGDWTPAGGVSLWRDCAAISVEAVETSGAKLSGRSVKVCPLHSEAILTYDDDLNIAVQTDNLALAGELDGSPVNIAVERAVGLFPGRYGVYGADITLGDGPEAYRFNADALEGEFDALEGGDYGGIIAGLDAHLPAVPLDITGTTASWRFGEGGLRLEGGSFSLSDRPDPALRDAPRFNPLIGQGMQLDFVDGVITARSDLVHPGSRARIARVDLTHDLGSAVGGARIAVDGLRFNDQLQPDDLIPLALGVIAAAEGRIDGEGRIDWNADDVTSSGVFRSDGFDFAAAFGPVRGVRGEITFTDLISLTTAPSQVLEIASVNPGIEALEGRVVYSMENGETIRIEDARWPFMGGELILRPNEVTYGGVGGQNYIFELIALDAATFVTQMELTNLGATGKFDGTIPIFFDEDGNGFIRGGLLIARPPGGNVAYVGELTYEDLGAMGNFAFQTLRSLDYRQMAVELEGSLAGEIVTRFQIDGVRQGEGTSQNFITRRIAKLPIRFAINVRSDDFYLLATIVRGLFDPRVFDRDDIRERLGVYGAVLAPTVPDAPDPSDEDRRNDEPAVQPPESEDNP